MLKPYLHTLMAGRSLSADEMAAAMGHIMAGEATPAQIAALLVALRLKGETPDEIAGAARVMRQMARRVPAPAGPVIDTCGTGGDHSGSFNISTTTAFVVAACGGVVAKHGNHSHTSASGSADVLQALGVRVDAGVEAAEASMRDHGIGFLYAPQLHQAMRHASGVRRELGMRSIFNLLGPLANPAGANFQLIGVYDAQLIPVLVSALAQLGLEGAMVVHGSDGLDELTTCGLTHIGELRHGVQHFYTLDARELGLDRATRQDLLGGTPAENAAITRAVLCGEPGPRRDIVLLNAAAALRTAGIATDWRDGLDRAASAIDEGRAIAKLEALIRATAPLAPSA